MEYKVITSDFIINSGSGYTMFSKGYDLYPTGVRLKEVVVASAAQRGTLVPMLDGRQ